MKNLIMLTPKKKRYVAGYYNVETRLQRLLFFQISANSIVVQFSPSTVFELVTRQMKGKISHIVLDNWYLFLKAMCNYS